MIVNGRPVSEVGLRLVKVSAGGRGSGVILSDDVLWVRQHWFRRAVLCMQDGCPACAWNASREVGFMAIQTGSSPRLLIELSPSAFERLAGLAGLESGARCVGLAGWKVDLSRRGNRSPLVVDPVEFVGVPEFGRPTFQVLASAVMRLYGLPALRAGETVAAYSERIREGQMAIIKSAIESERLRG